MEEVRTEAAAVLQQLQVLASRRTQEMREIQGVSQALCPMAEEEGPDSMLQAVISLSANREMHRIVQEDQLVQDFMKLQAQFDTLAWKNSVGDSRPSLLVEVFFFLFFHVLSFSRVGESM